MDLFDLSQNSTAHQPLAERLRPKEFSEFIGQTEQLGPKSPLLLSMQKHQMIPNLLLYGPPGCGKTTFAKLLGSNFDVEFVQVNAVDTGAKRLKEIGQAAQNSKRIYKRQTLLFIDEIHRLNRAQQDVLLPFTERGDFSLVGATTENPGYEINSALLSRCKVILFSALNEEDQKKLLLRAAEKTSMAIDTLFTDEAADTLVAMARGDGRKLLNFYEQLHLLFESKTGQQFPLTSADLEKILQSSPIYYDKSGDEHYNCISAFIKSIRGSDPNAGLYYLARMLAGGEDPVFVARRLVILASEDVGNADPRALGIAVAGLQAVELVGMPEAAINLAQVVTYIASAPKSNRSYLGWLKAKQKVEETGSLPVPLSLRSAQTKFAKEQGFGKDYLYSHDGPTGWLEQDFLPEQMKDEKFYEPTERGFEKQIQQYQAWIKGKKNQ